MHDQTANSLSRPYEALMQTIAARLEACVSRRFDIVSQSQLPYYLETNDPTRDTDCQLQVRPEVDTCNVSRIVELSDQHHVLIVPVLHHGIVDKSMQHLVPVFCLVTISSEPFSELVCALADTIVESEQLRMAGKFAEQKLDHSLFQITASFEELTWLRSLAEHFEICSLEDGLARAGQATLPALRELIYAEELVLLGTVKDESCNRSAPPVLARDGDGLLDEEAILELFLRLTLLPGEPLIVWNAPISVGSDEPDRDGCAVRNCILVPVTKADELHGWLLAINKSMPYEAMLQDDSVVHDQNLVEFGTSEAGLLSTMAVMLATHNKNVNLLCEKEELLMGVLRALVSTIDAKDAYTGGHSDRVASYSKKIAISLGLPAEKCEEIYMSGLLHDIGKIGVPDAVLGKPERLTAEEFEQIKRHPVIGYDILKSLKPFEYLLDGVLYHHESFDGSGYPYGLAGDNIPLMGRIIAVADSYDAMTSNRTYRQGMPVEKAIQILKNGREKQWDPRVIDAFLESLEV